MIGPKLNVKLYLIKEIYGLFLIYKFVFFSNQQKAFNCMWYIHKWRLWLTIYVTLYGPG